MIKVGIIGLGRMGGYHANVCKIVPNLTLVAVADPNEKNLQKVTSTKIIKSKNYKTWLDKVEAVIIAVPTNLHYLIAKDCLLNGKHVLVEKPLTRNITQAEELFQIAQIQNRALHVGHVERFNGAVQELKKIIQKPYLIESRRLGPFSPRVQNDSVILDLMIHDLDIIINLVDSKIKNVNVISNKINSKLSDLAIVQIGFENGTMANIISSRASQKKQRTMTIHQENAFIKLDFTTQDIAIFRNTSDSVKVGNNQLKYKQESTIERLFVYKDNPLKQEIEYFAKAIKTKKNLLDIEKNIAALRLTLEIDKLAGEQLNDSRNSRNRQPASSSL